MNRLVGNEVIEIILKIGEIVKNLQKKDCRLKIMNFFAQKCISILWYDNKTDKAKLTELLERGILLVRGVRRWA